MLGDYDDARFKELAMRFSSPVYPGEMIQVEIWKDGSFSALVNAREVVVVNNGYAAFAAPAQRVKRWVRQTTPRRFLKAARARSRSSRSTSRPSATR